MGYRAKRKIARYGGEKERKGAPSLPSHPLSELDFCLRPIPHLGACSQAICKFLEKHNIIYKYQFGFRKGFSTELAILETTDNLNMAIDNKQITCGIFLDFSKAFDTVNYNILSLIFMPVESMESHIIGLKIIYTSAPNMSRLRMLDQAYKQQFVVYPKALH